MAPSPKPATSLLCVFMTALLLPVAASNDPDEATLRLVEVLPDPDSGPEFIEILNDGRHDMDLAGWRLQDASGATYVFASGWALGPGSRLVVWSGAGATETDQGPAWRRATVWNNDGDAASLLDPSGNLVDWLAYGSGRAQRPPGYENRGYPAAPAPGQSVAWHGTYWQEGEPTPGRAPGSQGGITLPVLNVEPIVRFLDPPAAYQQGEALVVEFMVSDGNGPGDIKQWQLSDEGLLATGNQSGLHALELKAPASLEWRLHLSVEDHAGASATRHLTLLADRGLRLSLPVGDSLPLPRMVPGARNVTTLEPIVLHNLGQDVIRPLLDVSDFRQGRHRLPVVGNLVVGVAWGQDASPAQATWITYTGPLTPLGSLEPDARARVWLRLSQLPGQMAAGNYTTSFAVVT